ncbi:MAG: aconitate hydratase, partial [Bacteroidota bacterium]|nr:aconitate hydratase [Bacteroidota bacterium]
MKTIPDITQTISTPLGEFKFYSLRRLIKEGCAVEKFPFSIRILLENVIRNYNGFSFNSTHLENILNWKPMPDHKEIPYLPSRVLMQDFTGVPSIVDIASIRSEVARKGKNPKLINPRIPVDLIIDHSVQVDFYGTSYAFQRNVELEYERNTERYSLLKWAQLSFENFNVLPPGMGICHQVNLEYLAQVVTLRDGVAFPDTLVGTDSHTPMVNGIGVIGWGVGGIEAEAVMLGQPIYIMLPEVIGLKLTGNLTPGTTSTDLVLSVAELLRKKGVVGKFVEVFGHGLDNLTVPDRATISNMSPEFGCTVTYFPPDEKTLEYLAITGRNKEHIDTVEKYLKTNLLWRENEEKIEFTEIVEFNLSEVEPALAGPKHPQDRIPLRKVKSKFIDILKSSYEREYITLDEREEGRWLNEGGRPEAHITESGTNSGQLKAVGIEVEPGQKKKEGLKSVTIKSGNSKFLLSDGFVVIAAITSCTNTSNPGVMLGAGLVAKKAVEKGLKTMPWVKTSLAPGSRVVTTYLEKANLLPFLEALGFYVVGYGCTTCIGNSGPLPLHIAKAIADNDLIVSSMLSGNRNFESRIHPLLKMNFLASPLLVVAYAIAGRIDIDFENEPLGFDPNLEPVYLRDIWPAMQEVEALMHKVVDSKDYITTYKNIFQGDNNWETLAAPPSDIYLWNEKSSYIREVPFFKDISSVPENISDIKSARVLLKLGDSITTDHISPAGNIAENSPAGEYLISLGIDKKDFNSYGSRRGNHEVMVRGTFANARLKNELTGKEGGLTLHFDSGSVMSVFEAAMKYKTDNTPLIILAGKEYGSGSSRDWAAKGVSLLGVRAIIAESFERIHRSNLVGMGVLPLQFINGENCTSLGLTGDETFDILNLGELTPNRKIKVTAIKTNGNKFEFIVIARLDSIIETDYYLNGGILQYV